jgi:glycosyltransferase involved in cell wall biosynthesis
MAAGVPVVGTNIGGITDYAKNQYNCLLVSPGKPQEAAEAIMRIKKDQKLAKKLIANGLKTVSTKYSWDKIAEKVYSIMNEIHVNV